MPRLERTVKWRDVSGGNVQKVSSDITIRNSVPFSLNVLFDEELGLALVRKGTGLIGNPSSGDCIGLFNHLDSTAANNVLFAGFGTSIFNGATGDTLASSLTSGAKQHYATFLNTTLMLNGSEARSYTSGGGFVSTGGKIDIDGIPSGAQFPIEFKDRMYCAVTDRIYYTNTPTGGSVSWSAAGSGSLQAEQEDGGGTIQGLSKVPGYLLIFKQRSLKRWNFDSTFPEDLINIGTQSSDSILRARGQCFFFYGPNGFYQTNGTYPKLISRPVQRVIDAIPSSSYSSINGWSDNDNLFWSIGDITMDFGRGFTEAYTNVVLRYSLDSQQWAALSYAHNFKKLHQYISGTDIFTIGADDAGQVLQLDTGNSDYGGIPITYILQSPEFDFKAREKKKTVSERIFVHSDQAHGALVQARLDYKNWQSIGSLEDVVTDMKISPMTAHVFEFRITDSTIGAQSKLRGIDFPNVDILDT